MTMLQLPIPHLECFILYTYVYMCVCIVHNVSIKEELEEKRKKKVNLPCNQWEKTKLFLLKRVNSVII